MRDGQKTKARIERMALELFAEKGIHATTVRDIAARSQVAEGSLYRYYPSKDALARRLFLTHADAIRAELMALQQAARLRQDWRFNDCTLIVTLEPCPMCAGALVQASIIYICDLYDRDPVLFSYLFLSEPSTLRSLGVIDTLPQDAITAALVEAFTRRGQTERDPVLVTAQIMGTLLQAATYHLYGKLTKPLADYSDELFFAVFKILEG